MSPLTTLPSGTLINMANILIAHVLHEDVFFPLPPDHPAKTPEHPGYTHHFTKVVITFVGGIKQILSSPDSDAFLALATEILPYESPFPPTIGSSTQEER